MSALHSFRFVAHIGAGTATLDLTGEFSAPADLHEHIATGTGTTAEVAFVGHSTYVRNPTSGRWTRSARSQKATEDPTASFSLLARATDATETGNQISFRLNGSPAQKLGGATARTVTGTATIGDAHISVLDYSADGRPAVTAHFVYTDLDATPPVTVPPLG